MFTYNNARDVYKYLIKLYIIKQKFTIMAKKKIMFGALGGVSLMVALFLGTESEESLICGVLAFACVCVAGVFFALSDENKTIA